MSSVHMRSHHAPKGQTAHRLEAEATNGMVKAAAALGITYAGWKFLDGKYNVAHDMKTLGKFGPTMGPIMRMMRQPGCNMMKCWYMTYDQPGQASRTMFIEAASGKTTSFGDVEALSNKIGHWALSKGFKAGDTIALMMDNRAEYVATWMGLAKVGVAAAMINTNIKGKPLVHSITIADSAGAIFGSEHLEVAREVADDLKEAMKGSKMMVSYGGHTDGFCDIHLDDELPAHSDAKIGDDARAGVHPGKPLYYIYTSGTTGLPKACNISHVKWLMMSSLSLLLGCGKEDVVYGSGLPLYHSAANIGVNGAIRCGNTYVIRGKFSASQQWEDIKKYNCTAMQYIGELCRYLLTAPETPLDKAHKIRVAFGNGLRPEIWNDFQRRFNIPEIGEFYGATEGNGASVNHCVNYEGQGAVGRAGSLWLKIRPMKIVKFDVENEVPIRGPDGWCIECADNEAGELVTPIKGQKMADGSEVPDFEGYTTKEATEKKILRDAFQKGDSYFRSGDLLRRDAKGYYYFVDRIGDTFRWKGENVSTMEVSEVLSTYPGIVDANVYGAAVEGKDGRACMVAITLEPGASIDPEQFATHCKANLPSYSIPVFIRFLTEDINLTGTLKHQKVEYRNQGCDPATHQDKMWWYVPAKSTFEPYGPEEFAEITGGRARL